MYILGINADHNSSAAVLKDGKVIACVSEERFNRIKNYYGIPRKSIEYCMEFANIDSEELDMVVVASEIPPPLPQWGFKDIKKTKIYNFLKFSHQILFDLEWYFKELRPINELGYKLISQLMKPSITSDRIKLIQEVVNVDRKKILLVDHHLCHAYTTLYGCPFIKKGNKDILVFTADAEGDGLSATVSVFKNGQLKRISQTSQNNSVGNFYSAVTQYLGMRPGEHEYKVMGLAPYASQKDTEKVFNIIKDWIKVDHKNLKFETIVNAHSFVKLCDKKLKGQRFDWIAAASQRLLEERMIEWIEAAIEKTDIKTVTVSGGVFMNVKLNKLLVNNPKIKHFFVFPSSGDESNAFGCCYFGYKQLLGSNPEPIQDLYLGPIYDSLYVDKVVKKLEGFKIIKPKNLELEIAKLLSKGEIIARFAERAEWGARALGNRSILSDPSNLGVVERINKMIKNRDFWMPFAPMIMEEEKDKYLVRPEKGVGHYMMLAYDTKENYRDDMVAALHPYDKTARAQILVRDFNPKLWGILSTFKSLTGRGVLLNTSFNIHGEPIVGTPEDATSVLKRSGLKYLALELYLIIKNEY